MSSILNQNKLKGPNYVDWKRNLDIVLTSDGFKFMLVEECPIKPADATNEEIQTYDKWVKTDEMARCYTLAYTTNQHQSMTSTYDMFESHKEMFEEHNRAAKQIAMKALLTTKMAEES